MEHLLVCFLDQHPDMYVYQGEPHYFDLDENYKKGDKWYENTFFNSRKSIVRKKERGEKTPIYCFFKKAMDRIHKYNPNIKLIIFLRHPIGRAYSHYNHVIDTSDPISPRYKPDSRMFRNNNFIPSNIRTGFKKIIKTIRLYYKKVTMMNNLNIYLNFFQRKI